MIDLPSDLPQDTPVRRLSGATWAGLAFVAGTLFALLPMYYFYSGAAPGKSEPPAVAAAPVAAPGPAARETSDLFAARMSYELSQMPDEPPARPFVAANAALEAAGTDPPVLAARLEQPAIFEERPAGRVANARPISSTPPDPRDTTREMENEARRAEYARSPARTPSRPESPPGRVFEGRDVVIGTVKASIATRPIGTGVGGISRQAEEIDAGRLSTAPVIGSPERGSADAAGRPVPAVSGASRTGPAPQGPDRSETAAEKLLRR